MYYFFSYSVLFGIRWAFGHSEITLDAIKKKHNITSNFIRRKHIGTNKILCEREQTQLIDKGVYNVCYETIITERMFW